jgi:hypothetical protein
VVKVESKAEAEQLTRELLAGRLFALFCDLDERGYPFTIGELKRLRAVTQWDIARYQAAVQYFEGKLAGFK